MINFIKGLHPRHWPSFHILIGHIFHQQKRSKTPKYIKWVEFEGKKPLHDYDDLLSESKNDLHQLKPNPHPRTWTLENKNELGSRPGLLTLPYELREMIYLSVFERTNDVRCDLLTTCQTLYKDSRHSFFAESKQVCLRLVQSARHPGRLIPAVRSTDSLMFDIPHMYTAIGHLRHVVVEIFDLDTEHRNRKPRFGVYEKHYYQDIQDLLLAMPAVEDMELLWDRRNVTDLHSLAYSADYWPKGLRRLVLHMQNLPLDRTNAIFELFGITAQSLGFRLSREENILLLATSMRLPQRLEARPGFLHTLCGWPGQIQSWKSLPTDVQDVTDEWLWA